MGCGMARGSFTGREIRTFTSPRSQPTANSLQICRGLGNEGSLAKRAMAFLCVPKRNPIVLASVQD
jgi:hypothetical protein